MLVIKLNLKNQRLNRYTTAAVVPNSYGDLKLQFNFITKDWQSATKKVANFSYKSYGETVEIDENGLCSVPAKIVRDPYFYVSVNGFINNEQSIISNRIKVYVNPKDDTRDDFTSGVVFVPHIDDDKVLSWTIKKDIDGIEEIPPVDLNPFDEWTEDGDMVSEYEWEEDV